MVREVSPSGNGGVSYWSSPGRASVALHARLTVAFASAAAEVRVVPDIDSRKYCSVDWKEGKRLLLNTSYQQQGYSVHSPVHVRLQSHVSWMLLDKVHPLVPVRWHVVHGIRGRWLPDSLVLIEPRGRTC